MDQNIADDPHLASDPGAELRSAGRLDAKMKVTGATIYTGDVHRVGMLHVAIVRSILPSARIVSIDRSRALSAPGVFGVYTGDDVSGNTYGRVVRDVPILAHGVVRFVGEGIAAVLAETRRQAERAAALVEVEYEELPAVTNPDSAFAPGAPLVHESPWDYPGAFVRAEQGRNLQSIVGEGDRAAVDEALANSAHLVERVYTTVSGHQGYIEPWACVAEFGPSGGVRIWLTNKSPYRLREQMRAVTGLELDEIEIEPTALGGDFGGKGSPGTAPLCVELARLSGRPVKHVLSYKEDLVATNPRHPTRIRVRIGCDAGGHLTGLSYDIVADGGAYGGYKASPAVSVFGIENTPFYRVSAFSSEARTAYTNTVPKGHMRAPGAPQLNFALESAMDELALEADVDRIELRRRNLFHDGETDQHAPTWVEYRGFETLDAALDNYRAAPAPEGWLHGWGLSIYARATLTATATSLRLVPLDDGRLRIEIPHTETGAGSHTAVRDLVGKALGFEPAEIDVVQVPTSQLPQDPGAGGSRVSAGISLAADQAVKDWQGRLRLDESVEVVVTTPPGEHVGSFTVQIAQVAVDPETGECRVLEILTAIDVGGVINQDAHRMQVDGGTVTGFGFACYEDLDESDGQVWAANLGEFKIPSAQDVPQLRTIRVPGARGVGTANVKNIGESTTPPTAAAIANAIADATGKRLRSLPFRAERIYEALVRGTS